MLVAMGIFNVILAVYVTWKTTGMGMRLNKTVQLVQGLLHLSSGDDG